MMSLGRRSKTRVLSVGVALAVALSITGCQTTGGLGDTEAIKRTWESGMHRVPRASLRVGQFNVLTEIREDPQTWHTRVAQTKLKPGTKLPAVIYLHGCAGNTAGNNWANNFNELGYAFFAPDSLQRPRKSLCYTGRMKSYRIPMRREELFYALDQLRKLEWIDQKRIVLMGSSEGAQAASDYSGDEFAAVVLSATDCRFSGGSPNTSPDIPVLNMVGSRDKKGGGSGCRIRRTVGGSKRVIIKDAGHKLPNYPQARQELEHFLEACCGTLPTRTTASLGGEEHVAGPVKETSSPATTEPEMTESVAPVRGSSDMIGKSVMFEVPARFENWLDSGVQVVPGQIYKISAWGSWTVNAESCGWSGPDGGSGPCSAPLSAPQAVAASYSALVAKIDDGPAFLVGKGIDFTADKSGILYFRVNDAPGGFHNNEGTVTVRSTAVSSP